MAKDGDIIDTMFGMLAQLVGWVFSKIISLSIFLVTILFGLIGSGVKYLWNWAKEKRRKRVESKMKNEAT